MRQEARSPAFQAMDQEGQEDILRDVIQADRTTSILKEAADPLVRTKLAWYVMRDYLFTEAGLPDPSQPDEERLAHGLHDRPRGRCAETTYFFGRRRNSSQAARAPALAS